jgi:gliding motility-associated-like protein
MNIYQKLKMKERCSKIIMILFLMIISINGNSQNCPILQEVVLEDFCIGTSGNLTIVPIDASAAYNYSIDGGVTIIPDGPLDSVFTAILPGTHYIWLQEAANPGCYYLDTIFIPDPQDPLTLVTNNTDLICSGDSNATAQVSVIGGVLPYTYFWESTGETTNFTTNLWYGVHNVIVTDGNGCVALSSVNIENTYSFFNVTLDTLQQVQCYGENNGEVVLTVNSGGVPPYTFNWSNGQNYFGPSTDTAFNLSQGGYYVIIADAYGCDTTVAFTISEPPILLAQAISIQPVQCYGFDDGMAYAIGDGGAGDYNFSWSPIFESNDTIINLTPGIHTVTITDTNLCTASDTVLITEPTQLYVDIIDSSAVYSYCLNTNSGSLTAVASGGTESYSYSWDNTFQTTSLVTNLHADIYIVTVFDSRACLATDTFDLDSITNTFIPDSVDLTVNHISCYGLYDGSINVNGINGSIYGPYSYYWQGPPSLVVPPLTSSLINGLYEANYSVVIEDIMGCNMTLSVDVNQPEILEFNIDYVDDESCVGVSGSSCNGNIILDIEGGTSPYFYDNTFSGVFPIPLLNQEIVVNDTLISNLCNGVYDIHITDINSCQGYLVWGGNSTANVSSDVVVPQSNIFHTPPEYPTTSCFNTADGSTWVSGGANPLFNYSWQSDNSGLPSGIVLDTGGSYNNFMAGDYWLVTHYSDAESFGVNYPACNGSVLFTVNPGNSISSGAVITNTTCYGDSDGAISLTPTGSAPPFSFLWDTLSSIPFSNIALDSQDSLGAGVYTVSITDNDGCNIIESLTVLEPNPIIANFIVSNVSCFEAADGTAEIIVDPNSGQFPFEYSWNTIPSQNGLIATGLSGGIYTVTVVDSAGLGCTQDFNVTVVEPTKILSSVEPNSFYGEDFLGNPFHISCNGYSDGSIIVANAGGTPPLSFLWSGGQTTSLATNLISGPHTVIVNDANGCSDTTTIILNEPDVILPNISTSFYDYDGDGIGTEVSCFGFNDGNAFADPTGGYSGTEGYTYEWEMSDGSLVSFLDSATSLFAGYSYTVQVSDVNGCLGNASTVVFNQPVLFDAVVVTTNYPGPTHAPFSVNFIDSTFSADPYIFNWTWEDGLSQDSIGDPMNHEFLVENIGLNEVYVVLTNLVTGCVDSVYFDIDVQGVPDIINVFSPNSDDINDEFYFDEFGMKSVDVSIYNRWGQIVYAWSGSNKSWNGTGIDGSEVSEGVYFYVLISEGEDGYYYERKGSITLLR